MKFLIILLTSFAPFLPSSSNSEFHSDETIISLQRTNSKEYKLMIASSPLKIQLYTNENSQIVKIRNLLIQAAESKKANKELISVLATCDQRDPLINGYKGAATMIEAKHMFNPMSRWNKFKQGKALIENAIKDDAANYELRYLRFAIQTNIPPVLGYSANIDTDKKLLIDKLGVLKDTDLRSRVIKFLMEAKVCTKEDLNKLKQWKSG